MDNELDALERSRGNWRSMIGGGWQCTRCGITLGIEDPLRCGCDHNPCESPSVLRLRAELIQAQKKAEALRRLGQDMAAAHGYERPDGTYRPVFDNRLNELLQEGA